jgi:hypothetical protein
MELQTANSHLTSFFEILTLIEIVLVRLIMFALFIYGACHLGCRFYNLENPHPSPPMSSKFGRTPRRPKKNQQQPNDSAVEEKGICPTCGHLWYVHSKDGCMFHERPSRVFSSRRKNGERCGCQERPPL